MEPQKISDNFSELSDNIKNYVRLNLDLLKLDITEKLARVISFLLITFAFFVIFLFIVMFLSLGFIYWFGDHIGPAYIGALIVAGVYLLIGILVYLLRHKIFINPLISQLSNILIEKNDTKKE